MCEARQKFIAAIAGKLSVVFGRLRDGTPWTKLKQTCWVGEPGAFLNFIFVIIAIQERTRQTGGVWSRMVARITFALTIRCSRWQNVPYVCRKGLTSSVPLACF